jgi:acetylcholinesterase
MQYYYDKLVETTNCTGAASPLDCLRTVPTQAIVDFVNTTPPQFNQYGVNLTWSLTVDGVLLNKTLKEYVRERHYTNIPFIGGQVDDEGT